jgi:hypothetical protein
VLQPEVRMLLLRRQQAHPFSSGGWEFVYSELPAQVGAALHCACYACCAVPCYAGCLRAVSAVLGRGRPCLLLCATNTGCPSGLPCTCSAAASLPTQLSTQPTTPPTRPPCSTLAGGGCGWACLL